MILVFVSGLSHYDWEFAELNSHSHALLLWSVMNKNRTEQKKKKKGFWFGFCCWDGGKVWCFVIIWLWFRTLEWETTFDSLFQLSFYVALKPSEIQNSGKKCDSCCCRIGLQLEWTTIFLHSGHSRWIVTNLKGIRPVQGRWNIKPTNRNNNNWCYGKAVCDCDTEPHTTRSL